MSGSLYGGNTSGIQAALPPQQPQQNPLQILSTIQTIKNQQAQLLQTQANTAQTNQTLNVNRMNRQAQVAMGLYDLSDSQLQGGQPIRDALGAEPRAGTIDSNTYQQYMSSLPPATDENGNPTSADAFRQNIRSHIISTMTAPDAVKFAVGQPATVDTGGQIQPAFQGGALSSSPGSLQPVGQPWNKNLSPGEGAQRVTAPPNPDGSPATQPLSTVTPPPAYVGAPPPLGGYTRTNPPPIAGVTQPPPAGAVTTTPLPPPGSTGGSGGGAGGGSGGGASTNAPAPTTTAAPAPTTTAAPAPGSDGRVTTGLPAGFEDSRKMGQALTARAENVVQNKGNYQALLSDLQSINTGPGAERQQHIAAFFQKWAGSPMIAGLTSDDLARGEGFNKIATQISLAQGDQLGGTDQVQRATAAATPNMSLSTNGNTQIIHKLLGNEDAINEKRNAWNAWSQTKGPGDYNNFSQWWNKNVDLRSFQAPYMEGGPNGEKAATLNFPRTNQGQAAAKEFLRRDDLVSAAQKNGWQTVIPGGQQQPAGQ